MAALTGTITAFDFDRGLGQVTTVDGQLLPFHSVTIVDGTRSIEIGTVVSFQILLKLGRREAADIRPA